MQLAEYTQGSCQNLVAARFTWTYRSVSPSGPGLSPHFCDVACGSAPNVTPHGLSGLNAQPTVGR